MTPKQDRDSVIVLLIGAACIFVAAALAMLDMLFALQCILIIAGILLGLFSMFMRSGGGNAPRR